MELKLCPNCKAQYLTDNTTCPVCRAALIARPDPLIGTTLGGRYHLLERIGAGGMGTVYRARHVLLRRDVAIKLLSPSLRFDPVQRERFIREARATNLLRHDNIVDITDIGTEGTCTYLVMELLEGETLADRIHRKAFSVKEAIDVLMPVLSALGLAHELEIVHRDIKPENIFLCATPQGDKVKVLDFGIVHMRDEVRLTMTGEVFGTPEYMSPEQSRGATCSSSSDLYSIGVMFFEMLAAHPPFEGSSLAELLTKHAQQAPPRITAERPDVPPEIEALIIRLLAKDPSERPASAGEIMTELARFLPPADEERTERDSLAVDLESPEGLTSARAWRRRRTAMHAALNAAWPEGSPPTRYSEALTDLQTRFEELAGLEARVRELVREQAEREEQAAATRERIDRALGELSRDERAAASESRDVNLLLSNARSNVDAQRKALESAWLATLARSHTPLVIDDAFAAELERAGRCAADWRKGGESLRGAMARVETQAQILRDLTFQIEKLRQRLAAVDVELEQRQREARVAVSDLGDQISRREEALEAVYETVRRQLVEFPAARPWLG